MSNDSWRLRQSIKERNETVNVLREQVAQLTRDRDEMRQERDVARQGGEKLLAGLRAEEQETERLQNLVADERATAEARIQSLLLEVETERGRREAAEQYLKEADAATDSVISRETRLVASIRTVLADKMLCAGDLAEKIGDILDSSV